MVCIIFDSRMIVDFINLMTGMCIIRNINKNRFVMLSSITFLVKTKSYISCNANGLLGARAGRVGQACLLALGLFGVSVHAQTSIEGFESYVPGTGVGSVTGWVLQSGSAEVSGSQAVGGAQSLRLVADSTLAEASRVIEAPEWSGQSIGYYDFWVLPVAHDEVSPRYTIEADGSLIEFRLLSGSPDMGEVWVVDGDEQGGGSSLKVGEFTLSGTIASSWLNVVVRQDYVAGTWDVYLDGALAAINLGHTTTAPSAPGAFLLRGDDGADVYMDEFQLLAVNPLGTDNDNDGMLDAWETANGLSTSLDDRALDPDNDAYSNIEEYANQTDPLDYYNGVLADLVKVSGDGQMQYPGEFLLAPLVVRVEDGPSQPLLLAPVTFAGEEGSPTIATVSGGADVSSLLVSTDVSGEARAYVKMPETFDAVTMSATIESDVQQAEVEFTARAPLRVVFSGDGPYFYGDIITDAIDADNGDPYYVATAYRLNYSQSIAVDPTRTYRLSGRYRSVGEEPSRIYLGFQTRDENDVKIYRNISRLGNAVTLASYTDTSITVSETLSGWSDPSLAPSLRYLGFYYDGDIDRLPDYVIVDDTVGGFTEATGTTITIPNPLPAGVISSLQAQTKVMNFRIASVNQYPAASNLYVPTTWTYYSSPPLSGEVMEAYPSDAFRMGTRFVKLAILMNYNQADTATVNADDIIFEEIVDLDQDGIMDWWERERVYGLDPNDAYTSIHDVLPTADYDGDGLDLLTEYQQGKNPFQADAGSDVRYVDSLYGLSSLDGLSAHPHVPSANSGPKPTLAEGIAVTADGGAIVVTGRSDPYAIATITLNGKNLSFRPDGEVTMQ